MSRLSITLGAAAALGIFLLSAGAQAQIPFTYVSGAGDDANPCTRVSPCQTFGGTVSKTPAGGEIVALDATVTLGNLTIDKSITIDGGGGPVSVIYGNDNPAIIVGAGVSDVVTIRNITFSGLKNTPFTQGTNGIVINSAGVVHIEHCNIYGFADNGVFVGNSTNVEVTIDDTFIKDNNNGVQAHPTAGNAIVTLNHVRMQKNSNAGFFANPSGAGRVGAVIDRSIAQFDGTGILVDGNGTVLISNSTITNNGTGVANGGAVVLSYKDNVIDGNTTNGTPLTGTPLN